MGFLKDFSDLFELSRGKKKEKVKLKSLVHIYRVFGRHYRKYKGILIFAFISLFLAIGVEVLAPWPLKLILDHIILKEELPDKLAIFNQFIQSDPKTALIYLSISIVVLAILQAVFSYWNKFFVSSTGDRLVADIRERVFDHLLRLSLSFHESSRSGNMIYLLTGDIEKMKDILIDLPQNVIRRVFTFLAYAGLMVILDWKLALLALASIPVFYAFTVYFGEGMKKAVKKQRKKEGEVASILTENLQSMALVQAYGQEDRERERFMSENQKSLKAQLKALQLQKTFSRIVDIIVTLSTAAVLYFGGKFALGGQILPGTLVIFVAYLRDIYGTVEDFGGLMIKVAKAQVSGDRILEIVENDMIMEDHPGAIEAPDLKGHIVFDNVSFAYRRGHEVLKQIKFEIKPGTTVALVGPSGAGKSTLVSLLLRFYDPKEGAILIDGHDIRRFRLDSYRRQITVLLQDAPLFNQSVRDNIAFGNPHATEEDIIRAAKLAQAHDFIMEWPDGYNTIMEEGGNNLSGGQKQRINIARAIIRNTPIVILDEPGTGLDVETEKKIQTALKHLMHNKTAFIIAHSFSSIAHADLIILIDGGAIKALGPHKQLLEENPAYRDWFVTQAGIQEAREPVMITKSEEDPHHAV